jgi:PleD family two-component response regulator
VSPSKKPAKAAPARKPAPKTKPPVSSAKAKPVAPRTPPSPQPVKSPVTAKKTEKKEAPVKTTLDDLALDIDEKDQLLEEEKKDLVKVLREDEDEPLETAFVPTDTSERYILVVDEEGQRRNETMTIVSQILPNAIVEVADDPEEALEIMQEADFDTYVVNFLMPGYSASPFVKAVANHPDHPLLIGFAADKISDALDQKKGLKIIPLKRLFDLDVNTDSKDKTEKDE